MIFISCIIEEIEYCSVAMIKHLKRELVMTKKENENFGDFTKCWICNKAHFDGDVKVRDHCHITGKYRGPAQRNIDDKSNHKFLSCFTT